MTEHVTIVRHCCYILKNGEKCTYRATQEYDGKHVCKLHLNQMKATEDCSICFCQMRPDNRIKLKCGHYFHTACLAKCSKAECPICRDSIDALQCCTIFDKTVIKPIAMRIFSLPKETQSMTHSMVTMCTDLSHLSVWHLQIVYHVLSNINKNKDDHDKLAMAANTFLQILM